MVLPYQQFFTLAKIGPFEITTWGFFVVLGFLIGLYFIINEAKRNQLNIDFVYSLGLAILLGGIIGGRVGWLLTVSDSAGFIEAFKIWNGGMIWHGGLLGGLICFLGYAAIKKIDVWRYLDVFAIGLPLGHAIGRIGCHLIGDHVGKLTTMPWGIVLGGGITHPVSLYEVLGLFAVFLLVLKLNKKNLAKGVLFSSYVMMYAVFRFFNDFLRIDPTYFGLTIAQYTSIVLLILFGLFAYQKIKRKK